MTVKMLLAAIEGNAVVFFLNVTIIKKTTQSQNKEKNRVYCDSSSLDRPHLF